HRRSRLARLRAADRRGLLSRLRGEEGRSGRGLGGSLPARRLSHRGGAGSLSDAGRVADPVRLARGGVRAAVGRLRRRALRGRQADALAGRGPGWGYSYRLSAAYSFGASLGSLVKASSTSSSVIRLDGSPGWLRFCSSVPSPIMPGWGSLGSFSAMVISSAWMQRQSGDGAGRSITPARGQRFRRRALAVALAWTGARACPCAFSAAP